MRRDIAGEGRAIHRAESAPAMSSDRQTSREPIPIATLLAGCCVTLLMSSPSSKARALLMERESTRCVAPRIIHQ